VRRTQDAERRRIQAVLHDGVQQEIAYTIHPPVLSDRGLLEAIEAQSTRLAVPMAVRADPGLRGVRFAAQIDPGRPRGLGLTGLSDRLDTVAGSVIISSEAGLGTSVCVSIPVGPERIGA
jgi:signal transduction histidine kinase